jgi:hypothetical protein
MGYLPIFVSLPVREESPLLLDGPYFKRKNDVDLPSLMEGERRKDG